MSASDARRPAAVAGGSRLWMAVAVRSLLAFAVGLAVTFSSDHSAPVGHVAFGVLAVGTGIVVGTAAIALQGGIERALNLVIAIVGLGVGLASLLSPTASERLLPLLVSGWAVVTGFLELYLGIRGRRRSPIARDQIFLGALTVLLAVIVLAVPADLAQTFTGPDQVQRTLTGTIVVVGLVGAYAAIVGVFLAIAALSLRWASRADAVRARVEEVP